MRVRKAVFLALTCLALVAGTVALGPRPATFRGHTGSISRVVSSPDGKTLASVSDSDGTIQLWDVASRKERGTLPWEGRGRLYCLGFSPDGKALATGGEGGMLCLRDVVTGTKRLTLQEHQASVCSLAFSPDGNTLATGRSDGTVRCWQVTAQNEWATFRGHTGLVTSVTFSADGKMLASGGYDAIRLWDVATGKAQAAMPIPLSFIHTCAECLAFSPDGNTLASGHWMTVALWDVAAGKLTDLTGSEHSDETVTGVYFSPDAKTLTSLGSDQEINLWDVARCTHVATFEWGSRRSPSTLSNLLQRGRDKFPRIAALFPDRRVDQYDVPLSLLFTPAGKVMALGYATQDDTAVKMWRIASVPKGNE